ncbi:MAG: phosphate-starvation-inducible PsiE family protein [Vulcanimicrobiaceae bacterium]
MPNSTSEPARDEGGSALNRISAALISWERIVFIIVGILLFVSAVALAWRSIAMLALLFVGPQGDVIEITSQFLDLILLILMIAEIAYTVTESARGEALSPRPFLIVGLIAVIRRVLVITVQEVQPTGVRPIGQVYSSSLDLALLTAVVLAFVFSLWLLGRTPRESGQGEAS